MSVEEAERFSKDLTTNKELLAEVMKNAAGVASVVKIANAHGYSVTVDEAKQYIESRSPKELTDEQLDAVAGGRSKATTSTQVVQTTTGVTSAVEAAEVATTALVATQIVAVGAAVLT